MRSADRATVLVGVAIVLAAAGWWGIASVGSSVRFVDRSAISAATSPHPHGSAPPKREAAPRMGRLRNPGVAGTPVATVPPASAPASLRIPSIGVKTRLQRLHLLPDGTLQTPTVWDRAGWFVEGPGPGQIGPAVIAGHIDSTSGPAVFFRLDELKRGATVEVTLRDARVLTFVVDGSRRFAKASFPTDTVYGPTPDAQLRLITCTGRFDRTVGSYVDNLVVSAHLR